MDSTSLAAQLVGKPKKIGEFKGMPVMEAATRGGLHFVFAVKKSGSTETLGTGSHRAIARYIAQRENPACNLTELSKSESLPEWLIKQHLDEFLALTKQLRSLE